MNAATAFSHREEELLARLGGAQDMEQATEACAMALEQTACELAQDEQDEHARQRQQAVMAVARRAPQLLRAATARGELVLEEAAPRREARLKKGAKAAGLFLLAALAVYELIGGRAVFALLQAAGGALLLASGGENRAVDGRARGIPGADAQTLVRTLRELCRAVDLCVSDLALLDREADAMRLSGTADGAMLDLLTALLEAKASGHDELAMRSLARAEQYLRMLGVEPVAYDVAHAPLFDCLPTMGEPRTIRPALVQDGKTLRRGVAAIPMERSVGA